MPNLVEARTVGSHMLSEANQENWCSAIEGLTAENTIADVIDAFLLNCVPSNVLALQNRGMRWVFRLPEG